MEIPCFALLIVPGFTKHSGKREKVQRVLPMQELSLYIKGRVDMCEQCKTLYVVKLGPLKSIPICSCSILRAAQCGKCPMLL